jgi:hypothetical protein
MRRLFFPVVSVLVVAQAGFAAQRGVQDLIDSVIPVPKRAGVAESAEPPDLAVLRTLRSKAEFKVEIMPLADFAQFLSKRFKMPFKLDHAGLQRANVQPDAPISAEIEGMPLNAALRQILGRLNLSYRVVNGVVLITHRPQEPTARRRPGRVILHNGEVVVIQNGLQGQGVQPLKEQALQLLRPVLQTELLFVQRICKPTKDQSRQMKDDLENCVKEDANELFDLLRGRAGRAGSELGSARLLLEERLAIFVEKHLSKEKAAFYRRELQSRDANEREACSLRLVAILDRELCLSARQREAIRVSLLDKWDETWAQAVENGAVQGNASVPFIPDALIEPNLESAQIDIWENIPKAANVNWGLRGNGVGWFGRSVADPDDD